MVYEKGWTELHFYCDDSYEYHPQLSQILSEVENMKTMGLIPREVYVSTTKPDSGTEQFAGWFRQNITGPMEQTGRNWDKWWDRRERNKIADRVDQSFTPRDGPA